MRSGQMGNSTRIRVALEATEVDNRQHGEEKLLTCGNKRGTGYGE